MKYYAVFNNVKKEPDAIFKTRRWAENFKTNQKSIWVDAKFYIWEVEIPRMGRRRMVVIRKVIWLDYVLHGFKLLLNSLKNNGRPITQIFGRGK